MTDTPRDTRRAVLRVACGVSLWECQRVLGAVVPQVCSRVLHTFLADGVGCAVTGGRVHARATPIPKGVTALPQPLQPLLDVAHTGSRADCSPPVCTLCFSAALQSVCQALACRLHESSKCGAAALSCCEGPRSSALPGLAQLADIGRCRAVYQCQGFLFASSCSDENNALGFPEAFRPSDG